MDSASASRSAKKKKEGFSYLREWGKITLSPSYTWISPVIRSHNLIPAHPKIAPIQGKIAMSMGMIAKLAKS